MLMYVLQEAAAKQAAWEQEQARIARERHLKEVEEQLALERKRMEVAEAKQVHRAA